MAYITLPVLQMESVSKHPVILLWVNTFVSIVNWQVILNVVDAASMIGVMTHWLARVNMDFMVGMAVRTRWSFKRFPFLQETAKHEMKGPQQPALPNVWFNNFGSPRETVRMLCHTLLTSKKRDKWENSLSLDSTRLVWDSLKVY